MKKKYKICFLIQGNQHYAKLFNIAKILRNKFDILFLIEERRFSIDKSIIQPEYEYKYLRPHPHQRGESKFNAIASGVKGLKGIVSLWGTWVNGSPLLIKAKKALRIKIKLPLQACIKKVEHYVITTKSLFFFIKFTKNITSPISHKHLLRNMDIFLSNNKFDCLILAEANVEYLSEVFIKQARRYKIPSIIIPYTFCLPSEPARHYYEDPFHIYRWYHRFFISPKWGYKYKGRNMLRMYIYDIISMTKLGISPPKPWIQESSTADALVVESEMMRKHYLACKLRRKQLQVIGDEVYDQLFSLASHKGSLRKEILGEIKFKKTYSKIITFAIFPDFMFKYASSTGFKTYEALLEFICKQLAGLDGYNVILCLHPSLKKENFKFLETGNIKLSSRKTAELIVISDLYIASISATIRWAIALGVPVINYDCYQMRYGDYENVSGVINVETKENFIKTVDKLKRDDAYLNSLALKQKVEMKKYGIIDGKFSERLEALIRKLIEKYKSK